MPTLILAGILLIYFKAFGDLVIAILLADFGSESADFAPSSLPFPAWLLSIQ